METITLSLLLWLCAHSDYDVAHLSPPPVRLLSPEAMTALYYAQTESGAPAGARPRSTAASRATLAGPTRRPA